MSKNKITIDENKLKILKVKDDTDKLTVDHTVFSLPIRGLLIARSGQGKNSQLLNIMCSDLFKYNKLFKGKDIYIFAPDPYGDEKMRKLIDYYQIEDNNIYSGDKPDLEGLEHVYKGLIEEFRDDPTQKPVIIIDDYSSTGIFAKQYNILTKIFCNSRKYQINIFFLQQAYVHTNPAIRSNANVLILGNCSNKNLKLVAEEHNYLKDDKTFKNLFREHTKEQHHFFIVNYTNSYDRLYLDKDYKAILNIE